MGAPTRATLAQSGARFALTLLRAGLRQQGSVIFQALRHFSLRSPMAEAMGFQLCPFKATH